MTIENYHYRVAGHSFVLTAATDPSVLLPSLQPFAQASETPNPLFTLTLVGELLPTTGATELTRFEWEDATCIIYTTPEGYEITVASESDMPVRRMHTNHDFTRAVAEVPAEDADSSFIAGNFLMMFYAFATATHSTLMFHASVIRYNGQGYLFLGKSGTGKSTHSSLWLRHIAGSELLNDDNPIVRYYPDGRVMVYGSPWSGKTPCYRNEEAQVGAFVRLQQAPHNNITREGAARAFASLVPSCSCFKQHPEHYSSICNTITRVVETIPVYKLECLPDADAAGICYAAITTGRNNPQ